MRVGGKRKTQAGVSLVEVMLAGALTSIIVLFMLGGFTASATIARANCESLCADNVAFDLIWREFKSEYDELEKQIGKDNPIKATWDTDSPYHSSALASSDADYPQYKYKFTVTREARDRGLYLNIKLGDKEFTGADNEHLLRDFTIFRAKMRD